MPGGTNGDEAVKHIGKRRVLISGRFFPQGAGAVVNTSNIGKVGWTVVRTSQGLFTVTLDRRFLKLVLKSVSLQQAAAGTVRHVEWGTQTDSASGHAVQIRVVDGAAAVQDVAADANNSISFEIEAVQDTVAG